MLDFLLPHSDDFQHTTQFLRREAPALRHPWLGMQPDLGIAAGAGNMDVHRLARAALVRLEMKAEAAFAKDDGHGLGQPARQTKELL
jgi:hypothetical protein